MNQAIDMSASQFQTLKLNSLEPAEVEYKKDVHRILVVEDCLPERIRLVTLLSKQGYHVEQASNGLEALELMKSETFSLVLTDWHMPVVDGRKLCERIKRKFAERAPYILLLTGRSSTTDLISGIEAGADDYLIKPFNSEELRVRVKAGCRLIEMNTQLLNKNELLANSYQKVSKLNKEFCRDLAAAAKLQRSIFPKQNQLMGSLRTAYFFKPALGVAGDTLSIIPLGNNHICFYQADVVGHGVRAAMQSYAINRYLLEHSRSPSSHPRAVPMQSPSEVLRCLNRDFACDEDCNDYFTIIYGIVNIHTGMGELSQGGHPHARIIDKYGRVEKLGCGGLPIGLFDNAEFTSNKFILNKGSILLIHTDGILSCQQKSQVAVDESCLDYLFSRVKSKEDLERQVQILTQQFIIDDMPEDDISLLALARH